VSRGITDVLPSIGRRPEMREVANVNAMAMGAYGQMQMRNRNRNRIEIAIGSKEPKSDGGEALHNNPTVAARETLPISSGRKERCPGGD